MRQGHLNVLSISDWSGEDTPNAGSDGKLGKIALVKDLNLIKEALDVLHSTVEKIKVESNLESISNLNNDLLNIKEENYNNLKKINESTDTINKKIDDNIVEFRSLFENLKTLSEIKANEIQEKIFNLENKIEELRHELEILNVSCVNVNYDQEINGTKTFAGDLVVKGNFITEHKLIPENLIVNSENSIKFFNGDVTFNYEDSKFSIKHKDEVLLENSQNSNLCSFIEVDKNFSIPKNVRVVKYIGSGSHTLLLPTAKNEVNKSQQISIKNCSDMPIVISVQDKNDKIIGKNIIEPSGGYTYMSDATTSWMVFE